MPDEQNGRVTLAVIGAKIDNLQKTVDKIEEVVDKDHDRINTLENQMSDFIKLKGWLIGGGVSLIGLLIVSVVILARYIEITHP